MPGAKTLPRAAVFHALPPLPFVNPASVLAGPRGPACPGGSAKSLAKGSAQRSIAARLPLPSPKQRLPRHSPRCSAPAPAPARGACTWPWPSWWRSRAWRCASPRRSGTSATRGAARGARLARAPRAAPPTAAAACPTPSSSYATASTTRTSRPTRHPRQKSTGRRRCSCHSASA